MQDETIVTAADLQAVWNLIASHKWIAVLALLVGGIVRLLKSDVPGPVVNQRLRAPLALVLGMTSSGLERVATGVPWATAFGDGLGAGVLAILLHVFIVESAMGGREPFRKAINAILGPLVALLELLRDPPGPPPPSPTGFTSDPDETKRDLPPLLKRLQLRLLVLFATLAMTGCAALPWLKPAAKVTCKALEPWFYELEDGTVVEVPPEDRRAVGRFVAGMNQARLAAARESDGGAP